MQFPILITNLSEVTCNKKIHLPPFLHNIRGIFSEKTIMVKCHLPFPQYIICYLPNTVRPYYENVAQSLENMDRDRKPRSVHRGQHFPSTDGLCLVNNLLMAFFSGGFSLRGPYSKIPDCSSANKNVSFHRIPNLGKICLAQCPITLFC